MKKRILGLLAFSLFIVSFCCGCGTSKTEVEEDYREQGIALMEQGNYQAALDMFDAALGESVGVIGDLEVDINMYKGMALYNLDRMEEAVEAYSAVIEFKPKNAMAYYYRGTIYLQTGDEESAVTDYNSAVQLEPTYELYIDIAENLQKYGYGNAATGYLRTALLIEPEGVDEVRKQAYIYYLNGDLETARATFESLAADGDEESLVYLAKFAFEDGDYNGALSYAEQGLALDGDHYREFLFQKAVCYEYLEDYTTAAEVFKQYLQLYPDDEEAQREATFLSTRE